MLVKSLEAFDERFVDFVEARLCVLVEEGDGLCVLVNLDRDVVQSVLHRLCKSLEAFFERLGLVVDSLDDVFGSLFYCCGDEFAVLVDYDAEFSSVVVHGINDLVACLVNLFAYLFEAFEQSVVDVVEALLCVLVEDFDSLGVLVDANLDVVEAIFDSFCEGLEAFVESLGLVSDYFDESCRSLVNLSSEEFACFVNFKAQHLSLVVDSIYDSLASLVNLRAEQGESVDERVVEFVEALLRVLVEELDSLGVLVDANLYVVEACLYGGCESLESFFERLRLVVDSLHDFIACFRDCCRDELACLVEFQAQQSSVLIHSRYDLLAGSVDLCAYLLESVEHRSVDCVEALLCVLVEHSDSARVLVDAYDDSLVSSLYHIREGLETCVERSGEVVYDSLKSFGSSLYLCRDEFACLVDLESQHLSVLVHGEYDLLVAVSYSLADEAESVCNRAVNLVEARLCVLVEQSDGSGVGVDADLNLFQPGADSSGEGAESLFERVCLCVDSLHEVIARSENLCADELAVGLELQADDFSVAVKRIYDLLSLCVDLCAERAESLEQSAVYLAQSLLSSLREHCDCTGV